MTRNGSSYFDLRVISFFLTHRYQFFLQIKKDVLQGRLPVSTELAAELAALALQCKHDAPPVGVAQCFEGSLSEKMAGGSSFITKSKSTRVHERMKKERKKIKRKERHHGPLHHLLWLDPLGHGQKREKKRKKNCTRLWQGFSGRPLALNA